MQGISGLGGSHPGNFLQNLQSGSAVGGGEAITPGTGSTGEIQGNTTTVSSRSVSMTNMNVQFGEFLASASASPQQTQVLQALVALLILIALLEQLQEGGESGSGSGSGSKMLDALSSGLGSGGAVAGSYFASSFVAYEQTTVTLTTSSGDAGAAGEQTGEQAGGQSQIDVTA